MTSLVANEEGAVARPLKVLVPLIKEDLAHAEEAGLPYKRAAGEKLLEAKAQLKHGEWQPWLKRNFSMSYTTAVTYMDFARKTQKAGIPVFSSMNEFHRQTGSGSYRTITTKQGWHEPVKASIDAARREAERIQNENLTRQQERDADRKLALKLIDIGYRVLSKELHPDKGGTRDAMSRLSRVRERLKSCA